jgi:hypothetical protein
MSNQIQYYIEYLSSWFYHNVIYTETTAVLLKFIVFVILLTLIVYENYVAAGVVVVICVAAYLYYAGAELGPTGAELGLGPELGPVARRVEKDELTTGVPLIKEGFGIAMPKIIMGDDSGKDYHRSNKFIEEDSLDFTDKYFNSKKCGIGSGIGGISMFGSNELIDMSRSVVLGGLYDFSGNYVTNDSTDTTSNGKRYKYFLDCVFKPVKRSLDSGGGDFRVIKKKIHTNVNTKIIDINKVIGRFNTTLLFNTKEDPTADYSKRISLSSKNKDDEDIPAIISDTGNLAYVSLINGDTNKNKLKNIQKLDIGDNGDNINDQMYAALLTTINNDISMNSTVKQRHLEIYAKVYEFRKKLDNIFANMRAQTKDDASFMYTVRVGESVVQELRMMLSYLKIIQLTNDIILFEETCGKDKEGIYKLATVGLPPTGTLDPIIYANKSNITGDANNIFKIPLEDDTYNNKDEKRYLYGITYYIDRAVSNQ